MKVTKNNDSTEGNLLSWYCSLIYKTRIKSRKIIDGANKRNYFNSLVITRKYIQKLKSASVKKQMKQKKLYQADRTVPYGGQKQN
jgi:hypothetical protein